MTVSLETLFDLKDKVVVITGGAGAIGGGLADNLAQLGARLALIDLSEEKLAKKAEGLRGETGAEVRTYRADISKDGQVKETFAKIYEDFGSIYGLINCAGISHVEFLSSMDIENWQRVMDINVRGTVLCTKYAGYYMSKNNLGRVINVSSLASTHGKPGYTAYTPSKAAVDGFTFTLAAEWGRKGITVNSIRPVFIVSEITRKQHGDKLEQSVCKACERNPQGRTCSPDLLTGLVVFLLSESSSYVSGQLIGCDGGSTYGDIQTYKPEEPEVRAER